MPTNQVSSSQSNITRASDKSRRKRKKKSRVIHVTIRPHTSTRSIYKRFINHHHKSASSIQTIAENYHPQQYDRRNLSSNSIQQSNHTSVKENSDDNRSYILQTREAWSDKQSPPNNYHRNAKRNKKKKCTTKRTIGFILLILLILIIITVLTVLLVIFLRTKTAAKPVAILRWNTTGVTVAGVSGVPGSAAYQLSAPFDVAIDYSYSLYISDYGNYRVQKYLRGTINGTRVAGDGTRGSSSNQLAGPTAVLVDNGGHIFVIDSSNNRVQLWTDSSISGTTVAGSPSGVGGSTNNMLSSPYDVTRDPVVDRIYVADFNNHRVMSLTLGNLSGVVAAGGNGFGFNNTQLYYPTACYFDSPSNSFIIATVGSNNIVRWILNDNHWTLIAGDMNGLSGNTSTLFQTPRDLTLDPMGNIYVVDRNNHRIQLFLAGQSHGITIAGVTGISGLNSTLLNAPRGLTLDNQLNLYVADTNNQRIQKFQRY